jgi:hypothetical protein
MKTSRKLANALLATLALLLMTSAALAADPGLKYPWDSEISDQKAGSILIFNFYTSGATSGNAQNTSISITNTSTTSAAFVHLFFVSDGCAVADRFTCFTATQTTTFLASDLDPGVSGYIVAIAVDGVLGCPTEHNFLIGDEYVKLASGHHGGLGAEAISALFNGNLPGCDANSVTAELRFNGVIGNGYNCLPRVLALSSIPSRADGNDTLLIVNRIGGNLAIGASTLGTLFGRLYDDAENGVSFSITGSCQLRASLSNTFPRTTPRFEDHIPAGHSGWLDIFSFADIGILGAAINFNPNLGAAKGAFSGARNLHKLTLSCASSYTMPLFAPSC